MYAYSQKYTQIVCMKCKNQYLRIYFTNSFTASTANFCITRGSTVTFAISGCNNKAALYTYIRDEYIM